MSRTAQEHADAVREALNFGYGGDPNYRPFYEDGITALDALLADVERLTAERDEGIAHQRLNGEAWMARAVAAEREVERLTAEIAEQKQAWWDQRNDWVVATKTNQEIIDKAVARAEAAEVLAERRLADLRTYWTHCGYPEWYGDEERAWLHAALTDAGPNATQTTERRLGMSEQTPQGEANVILRSLLARFAALQPDNTEEEQT